jgi:hypothetical protein
VGSALVAGAAGAAGAWRRVLPAAEPRPARAEASARVAGRKALWAERSVGQPVLPTRPGPLDEPRAASRAPRLDRRSVAPGEETAGAPWVAVPLELAAQEAAVPGLASPAPAGRPVPPAGGAEPEEPAEPEGSGQPAEPPPRRRSARTWSAVRAPGQRRGPGAEGARRLPGAPAPAAPGTPRHRPDNAHVPHRRAPWRDRPDRRWHSWGKQRSWSVPHLLG